MVGFHVPAALLIVLATAMAARGETLADLLGDVAAHARFASPARADVRIECGGCPSAGGQAILLGRGDALYVEVKGGQRALLRPGKALVVQEGKPVDAPLGTAFAGTDVLLEDLVPFAAAALRMPQISDDGPAGVVVTAAPAGPSAYSLLVHTIDRERHAIVRTLYYRDAINNLAKTRRDASLVEIAGGSRPTEVVVEAIRQATRTRLALSWQDAPDAPAALFDPAGLATPSGLRWP